MINHLAMHTRPEITYHLSSLSRFVTSPGPRHWLAAKHLLRYLKGTAAMELLFNDLVVTGWSDASFASCLDTVARPPNFSSRVALAQYRGNQKFSRLLVLPARIRK
jgi:hypothetical protein